MLAKKYFVTSGVGLSDVSILNAFDHALVDARISQCNLVKVSSILPDKIKQVEYEQTTPGSITYCVLSRKRGVVGESIAAGLGWSFGETEGGGKYGLVAEDESGKTAKEVRGALEDKLSEMASARNMVLGEIKTKVACVEEIKNCFGCVVTALVYVP